MMCKRNTLPLLLLILASNVFAEHYHIVSNNSPNTCQSYLTGTCFTLAELASNSSLIDQDNDLTLSFLPGEHSLTRRLKIYGHKFQNITLTGWNSINSLSVIKCQGHSGFRFRSVQHLNVTNLEFSGCGNVEHGGAIHVERANNILIKGCHFVDNHVIGYSFKGGAIYTNKVEIMIIKDSVFDNNSVARGVGGAISVNGSSIFSTNNRYINNSARKGGVIYVESGNIFSTSDYCMNNHAVDSGGAIFASSGGSIVSTGDHYISNIAEYAGGAIFGAAANISTTNDEYINNCAGYAGGAISVSSNGGIVSTGDHYINNSADSGGAIFTVGANISITNDRYINNSADAGGAIFANFVDTISSTNNHFIDNSAA